MTEKVEESTSDIWIVEASAFERDSKHGKALCSATPICRPTSTLGRPLRQNEANESSAKLLREPVLTT